MDFLNKVLSKELAAQLWEGHTIGTAESCTGGRIAEAIVMTSGASHYFRGGIICYHDDIKRNLLKVSPELIEEKTSVCEEVAIQLVEGACEVLGTEIAVASTGWGGPGGGTTENPVGTIFIACGKKGDIITRRLEGDEGRDKNLDNATRIALEMCAQYIADRHTEKSEEKAPRLMDFEGQEQ
ncbi:MAG: CinA family protein [Bacteroidaceae bacterium]|nr:CinA family protein [Bacteroidaceae bacterium]